MQASPLVTMMTTVSNQQQGEALAKRLLGSGLVACINMLGQVRSFYVYDNQSCDEPEQMLLIKLRQEDVEAVKQRVREAHPYEVPCIVVYPILDVDEAYLKWVMSCTQKEVCGGEEKK